MTDAERFYDEHIAPRLKELGDLCEANGLSMVAAVEWAPGEIGRTVAILAGSSFAHETKHGHSSGFLLGAWVLQPPPESPQTRTDAGAGDDLEGAGR